MSKLEPFTQVLRQKRLAFLIFDQELLLVDYNISYTDFFQPNEIDRYKSNLWDLFPEIVGNEDTILQILHGTKRAFSIEKLNKTGKNGKLRYYNLSFSILKSNNPDIRRLFCLIDDITLQASQEQSLRQRQYEIILLQSRLLTEKAIPPQTMLGSSHKVREIHDFIANVAKFNSTVLFQGESGTGKSLAARLVHEASGVANGPFVEINCAAIPETLLESELFGYEKGAFTNAVEEKKGLIEVADGGTLFLDEIGELPFSLQAKLLTFMERKQFRRIGSTADTTVRVRLIAASNKDLRQAVAEKKFREDLYFRINVVAVVLPPLREVGEDIILLANHFLELLRFDLKKDVNGFTREAEQKLKNYHWPGNVRELRNVVERAIIFTKSREISASELALTSEFIHISESEEMYGFALPDTGISFDEMEKNMLIESLKKTHGNQSKSARLLKMSLDTFRYRLKKFRISPSDYQ